MISVFDLFKIGIGPSSSHTVGPMRAGKAFADGLRGLPVARVEVRLYGSLAWTGKGHGTDRAALIGLAGEAPDTVDPDRAQEVLDRARTERHLTLPDGRTVEFVPERDIVFDFVTATPGHPNTLDFAAFAADGRDLRRETWYSVGGGFIIACVMIER